MKRGVTISNANSKQQQQQKKQELEKQQCAGLDESKGVLPETPQQNPAPGRVFQ